MQKCESRTKRVMSAIIAGMMALQVVAPTISYADDTVASTASSEDNSDTQIDPGVPVQTDTASSNTVTEPDSSESLFLFSFFDSKCDKKFFNFIVAEHIENIKTIYST